MFQSFLSNRSTGYYLIFALSSMYFSTAMKCFIGTLGRYLVGFKIHLSCNWIKLYRHFNHFQLHEYKLVRTRNSRQYNRTRLRKVFLHLLSPRMYWSRNLFRVIKLLKLSEYLRNISRHLGATSFSSRRCAFFSLIRSRVCYVLLNFRMLMFFSLKRFPTLPKIVLGLHVTL